MGDSGSPTSNSGVPFAGSSPGPGFDAGSPLITGTGLATSLAAPNPLQTHAA
jgi:hypothetical protein